MTPYLVLSWREDDAGASARALRLRALVNTLRPHWRLVIDQPGGMVAVGGGARAITMNSRHDPIVIIGDVFPRARSSPGIECLRETRTPFAELCMHLVDQYWGAYLAVQVGSDSRVAVFRDPIGMRDGISWTDAGLHVFASEVMPWLTVSPPRRLAIDWRRVAELLHDSSTVSEATPLSGIETIPAGCLVDIHEGRASVQRLWIPRAFYRRDEANGSDARGLRDITIRCVSAWTESYPNSIVEMSGGFDSSAVAAASTIVGNGIPRGINFFTDHLSGDERGYARDVSARCRIPVDEVFMPVGRIGEEDFDGVPVGARPGLSSATLFHDRPLARIAAAHGARALFTGHGGDSVFFQHPTAMIAADPSFPRSNLEAYTALAKWSRESAWAVASYAFGVPLARSRRRAEEALVALPLVREEHADSAWAGDLHDLPPAKRVQITAIATDRSTIGPSCRSEALTIVHPLLSQPLVEWAIATDTYVLTEGRRDRALARTAFAPMLPASVIDRMGKGVLAQYFGRCLCASVPFLRAYLLDGLLVQNKVLDAPRLEPMLDRDYLMRFDYYVKLRSAIVMEHWARGWQARAAVARLEHIDPVAAAPSFCPAM